MAIDAPLQLETADHRARSHGVCARAVSFKTQCRITGTAPVLNRRMLPSAASTRYEELTWVTTATAAATVATSWAEFSEDSRKVERYSSAVSSLKMILSWWNSLGEVQKASREAISRLVLDAEAVISEEQSSWTSTANNAAAVGAGAMDLGGSDEKDGGGVMMGGDAQQV